MAEKKLEKSKDESKRCFFITPIGSEGSEEYKKLEAIKKNILEPVLESFEIELIVAHDIHEIGSIGDQVFKSILDAKLIVSNMTGLNPNVMYETAVAHSFGIPTIMICENGTKLPFDLTNDRTIFFDNSIEGSGKLMEQLKLKIPKNLGDKKADNPVYRVIDQFASKDFVSQMEDGDPNKHILEALNSIAERMDYLSNKIEPKVMNANENVSPKGYFRTTKIIVKINDSDEEDELVEQISKFLYELKQFSNGSIKDYIYDIKTPGEVEVLLLTNMSKKKLSIMFSSEFPQNKINVFLS
ncbi:hypothetical protein JZO82_00390 [Vagococcus fluvialis]|uniref:hypothetical protein n=1 Tax=Vagococcus fluvialis TaxID=2738 RepID=UPI001A9081B5|nr:hypothetical protein [Vagococcus fluvialis]MBO0427609.1 hypothetical protein [Vagococcus fluvialis]